LGVRVANQDVLREAMHLYYSLKTTGNLRAVDGYQSAFPCLIHAFQLFRIDKIGRRVRR
jgi:hypothetical protein